MNEHAVYLALAFEGGVSFDDMFEQANKFQALIVERTPGLTDVGGGTDFSRPGHYIRDLDFEAADEQTARKALDAACEVLTEAGFEWRLTYGEGNEVVPEPGADRPVRTDQEPKPGQAWGYAATVERAL